MSDATADPLPAGAIDFHVHANPSLWERRHDAPELLALARERGLGGLVLKSHFGNTAWASALATAAEPGIDVYTSVTLNSFVGGFNPTAVELAAETGASVVWLPTFSAANFGTDRHFPFSNQSLTATDGDGDLRPEARAVLETVADLDRHLVLGNGHLGPDETRTVLDALEAMGADDVPYLITHADSAFMGLSTADQVALAERGAVIEKCYLPVVKGDLSMDEMVASVREIGVEACLLSTDHGQPSNESPPVAYAAFCAGLRERGVTDDELTAMARDLPLSLVEP